MKRKKKYVITKIIEAYNITEAIGKEVEAEIESVEWDGEEEDDKYNIGFHG